MFKTGMKIILGIALAVTPIAFVSQPAHAQSGDEQRAYNAGHQNGVNDRNQNKPLNLKTGNWHGQNLAAYQRGYEDGYRSAGRPERGARDDDRYREHDRDGDHHEDHDRDRDRDRNDYRGAQNWTDAQRRAYQAGFQNGVNDRSRNKPLNLTTGNWHNENLPVYQEGYQDGYRGKGNRLYNNGHR